MSGFVGDPEFTMAWPPHLVTTELEALLAEAEREGPSSEWREAVEQLLRQVFSSAVPIEEFQRACQAPAALPPDSGYDDEPF